MKNFFKGLKAIKKEINTIANKAEKFINEEDSSQIISNIINTLKLAPDISRNFFNKNKDINIYYNHISKTSNPILYIGVVSFNQKKGAIIEFIYPEKNDLLSNEETLNYLKSLCLNKNDTPESIIDNINNQLTYLCMPDGVHSLSIDTQYFLIQNFKHILYGISCYQQIQVTQIMKEDEQENTRECVQKAMCIVTKVPLFSQMISKLNVTMSAYFNQNSLKDKTIIKELYTNFELNKYKNLNVNEITENFSIKKLLFLLKDKIFEIIKLLLLEKKILIFSHISHNVCSFIFSLLSLFPGNSFFNLDKNYSNNSNDYYKCYSPFGFPLKFLNSNSKIYSLLSLYDVENIEGKNIKSFLCGTTNQLFLNYKKLEYDCLINIDEGKIVYNKNLKKNKLKISKCEKEIYKKILESINLNQNNFEFKYELLNNNNKKNNIKENNNNNNENVDENNFNDFKTSDDYLRNLFKSYFMDFLADISLINHISKEISLDSETKISQIKKILLDYNIDFIHDWIVSSTNFKFFFHEFNEKIWLRSKKLEISNDVEIYYENGDFYHGNLSYGKYNGYGELIYNKDNRVYTYLGYFEKGLKNGKGNLTTKDGKFLYDGNWLNDKKHGEGNLVDDNRKFNGNFKEDLFDGYGIYVNEEGNIFEGEFKENKLFGIGHLTYKNGDNYVGNFYNNKENGKGQLIFKNGDIYNGEFKDGLIYGKGYILYKDGSKYNGYFLNGKFNGKGILTNANGEIQQGIFENGELIKKMENVELDNENDTNNINNNNDDNNDFEVVEEK